jgi:hypothetical protein
MPRYPLPMFLLSLVALTACSDRDTGLTGVPSFAPTFAKGGSDGDPTATFYFPLADGALSVKSDGLFGNGTFSLYANGVCGVHSKIFATTAASNSGDAIMHTNNPKFSDRKCAAYPRTLTLAYSDGVSETVPVFMNVRQIENTTYAIPVGTTVKRSFAIQTARCEQLLWSGVRQGVPIDADSVFVTRVAADTWRVQSQPAPNDRASCAANGQTYTMSVDFTIVSSRALP